MDNYFLTRIRPGRHVMVLCLVLWSCFWLGNHVCAQDSRLYMSVPAKAGATKSGGTIGPLKNGEVYCLYQLGAKIKLWLSDASAPCSWTVTPTSKVRVTNRYGVNNDTIEITIIAAELNERFDIKVEGKEGDQSIKPISIVIPRLAAKPSQISVVEKLLADTSYCEGLRYHVSVAEDKDYTKETNNYGGSLYPEANLRYEWSLYPRDPRFPIASSDGYISNPETMYDWGSTVPVNAGSWRVQPATCENNRTADYEELRIINVIPTDLVTGKTNEELSVIAIAYRDNAEMDEDGNLVSGWDTSGAEEFRNACVWYSADFNMKKIDIRSSINNENFPYEDENGFVYLQAMPYKPKDISFRHYQYEWIFDTADLYLDTARMKTVSRMYEKGFGADKARVCFKVKERAKESVIKVSYRMHCLSCDSLAKLQPEGENIQFVSKESTKIELFRIDSLVDETIEYTPSIKTQNGGPVDIDIETGLPAPCAKADYQLCCATSGSERTNFLWTLPPSEDMWGRTEAREGCLGVTTPPLVANDGGRGIILDLLVTPANYCFVNGRNDTSRKAQYVSIFLRGKPLAPRIIDFVDQALFNGYTREDLEELVKSTTAGGGGAGSGGAGGGAGTGPGSGSQDKVPWPEDGAPYPVLLCNNSFFGNNISYLGKEQSLGLYTPGYKFPPALHGSTLGKDAGFLVTFPEVKENKELAALDHFSIKPYKNRELSDTNLLVFNFDLLDHDILAKMGKKQIIMSLQAANDCGAGDPLYFPVKIIDTISVVGHVRDLGRSDLAYDTVVLCEGQKLIMSNNSLKDGKYIVDPKEPDRNTDRVEYHWHIPSTWRFDEYYGSAFMDPPNNIWLGKEKGAVRLSIRNRCGEGKMHSGDSINVNPYTRINIKVVDGLDVLSKAWDPKIPAEKAEIDKLEVTEDGPHLLDPCRGSFKLYAADTCDRTDVYRWEFPKDWQVITTRGINEEYYLGTAEPVPGFTNMAYTRNTKLNSNHKDMRVRVKVGADTGQIYVVGAKAVCEWTFDNYEPKLYDDPAWYGHRRDSLRAIVRPFTGKPMQAEPWPDSICVRNCTQGECAPNVMSLEVIPDVSQDSLTRDQTRFTWKFPADYEPVIYSNSDPKDSRDKRNILTFTVPDRVGDYDTITVYSHRFDCEPYNEGDSMVVVIKLTDTVPFVQNRYLNDARRPGSRINTTPCEGDTVVYRVLPDPKKYLDSVWFTWNGGNKFADTAKGLIDTTGWRVLNPTGRYADTLKMIVGRSTLTLGAYAVSPCGLSSVFATEFNPIGLVRDTVHLVEGRNLLCLNEKVVFEWDSVKYATQYDWFYPWGDRHDTIRMNDRMFYREFSRRTAFEKGNIYVRPSNRCGMGPYSDTVKVENVIGHLGIPSVSAQDAPEFVVLRDTLYDTLCLRTDRVYEANYSDEAYGKGLEWRYRWFDFATNAQDTLQMKGADSSQCRFKNQAGFEDKYIGVAVHHKECASWGDTLLLRIHPADTVAINDATLADRLSDWEREDKTVMTRPCGGSNALAEWHFNSDFGTEKVQYRFVWWDSLSQQRSRQHDADGSMVMGAAKKEDNFTWLNPKTESDFDNTWYGGDEDYLRVRIPNNQLLYLSVDLKNRCGISRLPSLAIRTVVSITDSTYNLQQLSGLVCDGDSLVFRVDSSANIGGFIWHYPWGKTVDTVKVGTQVVRTFNAREYQKGEVYVVPFNGCGLAHESNRMEITDV